LLRNVYGVSHFKPKVACNRDLDRGTVHFGDHSPTKTDAPSAQGHPQTLDAALCVFSLWTPQIVLFGVSSVAQNAENRENMADSAKCGVGHKKVIAAVA